MYNLSSVLLIGILLLVSVLAMEAGHYLGRGAAAHSNPAANEHIAVIQAAVLGVLALLLGFTFALALQRYNRRSEAVVSEANAIGTAYLRAQLLPPFVRDEVQNLLRLYVNGRVEESVVSLSNRDLRHHRSGPPSSRHDRNQPCKPDCIATFHKLGGNHEDRKSVQFCRQTGVRDCVGGCLWRAQPGRIRQRRVL